MGLREKLNAKPALAAAVFGGLLAITLMVLAMGRSAPSIEKAFYSTDDGVTWFADDIAKTPPFDHDGKPAVRAYVVDCDGKRVVSYLERFTPAKQAFSKAVADAVAAKQPPPRQPLNSNSTNWGDEIKRPGDKTWVAESDLKNAAKIITMRCSDGSEPVMVTP